MRLHPDSCCNEHSIEVILHGIRKEKELVDLVGVVLECVSRKGKLCRVYGEPSAIKGIKTTVTGYVDKDKESSAMERGKLPSSG